MYTTTSFSTSHIFDVHHIRSALTLREGRTNKFVHLCGVKMTALYATISPHFTQDLRTPGK